MIWSIAAGLAALALPAIAHADTVDLLKRAMMARRLHDADGAIYYLNAAIAAGDLGPRELAAVKVSRGSAFADKADLQNAIADFSAAIELRPDFGEAFIDRGLIWAKKQEFDKAIADFTEAARVDPGYAFLALHDRANVYADRGDYEHALDDDSEAIRRRSDYPGAYYGRANSYAAIGETDKAVADFDAAIQLNPGYVDAYANRAAAHLRNGNTDKAIADLDAAVRLSPADALVISNRGTAYFSIGDYKRALSDFDEAVRLHPRSGWAYGNRGIARYYAGQRHEALADLTTAADLSPTDSLILIWLHYLRARTGQDDHVDFKARAAKIERKGWPVAVIGLYLGELKPEVSLTVTPSGENERTRGNCTKSFYLATYYLQSPGSNEAQTQNLLRAAAETCTPGSIEFAAAKAELSAPQQNR
jgi:tetratricopeptide (TPR) repeat protein